jgi:Cdc6-like AAA superfamily ATPase
MLDEKAQLVMRKIERLAKENEEAKLSFILVLLSNDGYLPLANIELSFERFVQKFGDDKYREVREGLIQDEALVKETQEALELNHYRRSEVAADCALSIFQIREKEFRAKINSATSDAEGEFILRELADYYYPMISQDKMNQLERDVGKKYFSKIVNQMLDSEIIFKHSLSPQQPYWRLFPPIRELFALKGEADKDALAYIYITQEVRSEGVLQSDCAQYSAVVPRLLFTGLVKEGAWYSHRLYQVTEKGAKQAKQIVRQRLEKNHAEIDKLLESGPKKLWKFLLQEIFRPYGFYYAIPRAHPEVLQFAYISCDLNRDEHRCLLKDPQIRDSRNKMLAKLKEVGLAYLAHMYVSTRGGETKELNYCLPPEITEYFGEHLTKEDGEELFTLEVELAHKAYHFLETLSNSTEINSSRVLSLTQAYRMGIDQSDQIIERLLKEKAMEKTGEGYVIRDPAKLKLYSEQNFHIVVDYLLGKEKKPVPMVSPPPPKPATLMPKPQTTILQPTGELSVLLGNNVDDGSTVIWHLSKEKNPHLLVVGTTGSGKTVTLKAIIYELKKYHIPCLILDFHDEYTEVDLAINIREGISINPLELSGRPPMDTKFETTSILREIYGLGDQQEAYLRKAIQKGYDDAGIRDDDKSTWSLPVPNFAHVKTNLEQMLEDSVSRSVATTLLNRLEPIFDIEIFSKEKTIEFGNLIDRTTAIQLKDLPTEEVKTAASDFFLRRLWYHITKMGWKESKDLRLYCVIDEGHRLAYEKSPLDQLLREARKYGVGIILASQRPSDFKETIVANVATTVCLQCPLESDAKFMAKQLRSSPEEVQLLDEVGKAIVKFSSNAKPLKIHVVPSSQRSRPLL